MRYQPTLGGVVLAHSDLRFLNSAGRIKADSPYAIFDVGFDATIWRPEIGMQIEGRVSLCSPDHVSLLVHRTFNVSIPRHHIPTDEWEFEYGPADNDPEFGTYADGLTADEENEDIEHADRGRWIHKVTAGPLGGRKGRLVFTVVGLTIANQMLSLVGSIQSDPFSTAHVPQSTQPKRSSPLSHDEDDEILEVQEERVEDDVDITQNVQKTKEVKEERKRKRKEDKAKNKKDVSQKTKSSKRTKT